MTAEYVPIDITDAPELARVADAVRKTGRPHALKRGDETIAVVRPAPKTKPRAGSPPPRRRRRRVFTKDDPLWEIVGMFKADGGPTDVSDNVDKYLAEAYLDTHEDAYE